MLIYHAILKYGIYFFFCLKAKEQNKKICLPSNALNRMTSVLDNVIDISMIITIAQSLSCVWLCDPIDYSMPDSSVLHYFPEFAQIHVHWVSDLKNSYLSISNGKSHKIVQLLSDYNVFNMDVGYSQVRWWCSNIFQVEKLSHKEVT